MSGTVGGRVRWAFCAAKGSLRETSDPSGTAQNEQNNGPWSQGTRIVNNQEGL